ncbi:MinD/ParA family protein [Pseudonocardia sp. EV170527-09]|uniref:MinD/ParA family ATP-binding protein n=1 Tax=Pseudonocardia sp. EV170527-09 TaxID=2603411 RepID=UPI001F0286AE|nr:MinD/ParA family protein [Pseudonocardia sp. EV170527-09]
MQDRTGQDPATGDATDEWIPVDWTVTWDAGRPRGSAGGAGQASGPAPVAGPEPDPPVQPPPAPSSAPDLLPLPGRDPADLGAPDHDPAGTGARVRDPAETGTPVRDITTTAGAAGPQAGAGGAADPETRALRVTPQAAAPPRSPERTGSATGETAPPATTAIPVVTGRTTPSGGSTTPPAGSGSAAGPVPRDGADRRTPPRGRAHPSSRPTAASPDGPPPGPGRPRSVPQHPDTPPWPRRPAPPAGTRPAPVPLPVEHAGPVRPVAPNAPIRYAGDQPMHGWRRGVYAVTAGRYNPGPSPAQLARQNLIQQIRRPLAGVRRIAVASIKGGVGKTTVSALLGLVLAENRGDRIVALDANPDAGTLADRLTGDTSATVRELLAGAAHASSVHDLDRFSSLAGRLRVIASEQDPAAGESFSREEYEAVCGLIGRFANVLVTDSGTGLVHSAMEGTLTLADALVVVGTPTVDGATRASRTLDWLHGHGFSALAEQAVVVLSQDRWSREIDRNVVRRHFESRVRAVVELPFDQHLAHGGRIDLARLAPATVDAVLLLAARITDGFEG